VTIRCTAEASAAANSWAMWSQRADGRGECRDSFASAVEAEHKAGADDGLGVAVGADDAGRRRHLGIEATDGSAGRHQVGGDQRPRLAEAKDRDHVAQRVLR